jgi:hypothetical protein
MVPSWLGIHPVQDPRLSRLKLLRCFRACFKNIRSETHSGGDLHSVSVNANGVEQTIYGNYTVCSTPSHLSQCVRKASISARASDAAEES